MGPEQIARATLAAIESHDLNAASAYAADSFTVSDPTLPRALDKNAFFTQMNAILQAFPDWKYSVQSITAHGDQVIAVVEAVATNTEPLQFPGMPPIPATGKRVRVPDKFIFTIKDDHISAIMIDSPANGGAAEMLRQLGIAPPSARRE